MTCSWSRREALALMVAFAGCGRHAARCAFCGMPIDPKSPWNADLVLSAGEKQAFDSPRCALLAWRTGRVDAKSLLVLDYYDRVWSDGADVLFVTSSDVIGPMGPDLVPVDPARAPQFAREHAGTRPLPLAAVTLELLEELH
jgi:copper chaperone NosL